MALRKDIWRIGVVNTPMADLLRAGTLQGQDVHWLHENGTRRFLADPFGLWRDGLLYLFAETYDYRDRTGAIDVLVLDQNLQQIERRPALREPWHLSYPFLLEEGGQTWMLPEAHKSKRLTLYRAAEFPHRWEAAAVLELPHVAIDATPFFHDGLWWLFYTPAGSRLDKVSVLHLAFAERLTGPWRQHPQSPVRTDIASSRPGGTPVIVDDRIVLPVQDCTRTYGGALRPLYIDTLTTERFQASPGEALRVPAGFHPYTEGLHSLSAAGGVTLLDAKRTEVTLGGIALDARRELQKLGRRFGR